MKTLSIVEMSNKGLYEVNQKSINNKEFSEASFLDEIERAVKNVDELQKEADRAMEDGAVKGTENIHETMIKLHEAEMSLRFLIQVRNKAIDAYREIMRMQL